MLTYELDEDDVGAVRLALSPLCELGLSIRALTRPELYPLQLPWVRLTEEARRELDQDALLALVNDGLSTPDFLNPRPTSPLTRIDEELDALRHLHADRFRQQLVEVHGEVPAPFRGDPRRAIDRMVDALAAYWSVAFAPHWPRMRRILEADIVYRGREVARAGLTGMLNGISPNLRFADRVLSVTLHTRIHRHEVIGGHGLTLVPTMFSRRVSAPIAGGEPPMILYAARGQGVMWEAGEAVDDRALVALIGRTRSTLLHAIAEPASSTELAARFGVTTTAVNQHLRALRDARLLTSARYGRSVLYFRTDLGNALLGG
jgi:DNA-binding transcriptional ArsR family regulator